MNLSYNDNEPAANNNPSNSQSPMLTNTKSINSWVNIDHHGFGDPIGGYHRNIRQDTATPAQKTVDRTVTPNTFVGIPGIIPDINQLFAANVVTPNGTDTQLFSKTGNNGLSQLTGNFASNEGYVWCAGVLIQWGTVSGSAYTTPAAVIFSARANCIAFPNNCFVVVPQFSGSDVSPSSDNTIWITGKSQTQFTWRKSSSAVAYTGFYWIAIGN